MKLLPSQKNQVYDLITATNFSPTQFYLDEIHSVKTRNDEVTEVRYEDSDYFFAFEIYNGDHYALFSPGSTKLNDEYYTEFWEQQLYWFEQWLSLLEREVNSPDKWSRIRSEANGMKINFQDSESKFSIKEYEDLKLKMQILKNNIKLIGLDHSQIEIINSKLDYLTEMAKDMNKYDWKGLFIGIIISVIIQLGVTQDNANSIWTAIKKAFNTFILL